MKKLSPGVVKEMRVAHGLIEAVLLCEELTLLMAR